MLIHKATGLCLMILRHFNMKESSTVHATVYETDTQGIIDLTSAIDKQILFPVTES